ncbi:MAG: hypothetical protein U0527_02365 [Candidatus Eisenbacteria bacterium]
MFVAPRGNSVWLGALGLLCLLQVFDAVVQRDLYDAKQIEATEKVISKNERISAEEKQKIMDSVEERAGTTRSLVTTIVMRIVAVWLFAALLPAGLMLFGANFVCAGRARFVDLMSVTTFSALVILPRELILIPLRRATGQLEIFVGPAALVSSDSGLLQPFLNLFDLFELYHLVPLALGVALVAGISRGKAWGLVISLWVVWAMFALGAAWIALRMGAL